MRVLIVVISTVCGQKKREKMENALEKYVRHFRMIFVKRARYQNILYLEECFTYWKIHLRESY